MVDLVDKWLFAFYYVLWGGPFSKPNKRRNMNCHRPNYFTMAVTIRKRRGNVIFPVVVVYSPMDRIWEKLVCERSYKLSSILSGKRRSNVADTLHFTGNYCNPKQQNTFKMLDWVIPNEFATPFG
jgi:hypothetical protein